MTTFLLIAAILALVAVAWLFRQRLTRCIPRKDTMLTVTLITSIATLALLAVLPDLIILLSALKLLPPLRIILALAALAACVGCSKQSPEPAKPAVIHWQGQDGGYEDTTTVPPDKAATQ